MYDEIASGGMATVHFGRLLGAAGFLRTVAIKHLLPHYSRDADFISMFLDEARLAARIQHPNVTVPLDVVVLEESEEIFLVMEYIHGENLALLLKGAQRTKNPAPPSVSASIMSGALHGLHAAHEATNELGLPLNIVHRDVSPQNIMVGADGVARVLDFGVAKAISRLQSTRQGQMKGKLSYMAPEQVRSSEIDRRVDIFAAGIVFWEALTLKKLFKADDPAGIVAKVIAGPIVPPSVINPEVPPTLDRVVMTALERDVSARFQTAGDFASAIEEAIPLSARRKVGEWVTQVGSKGLALRADKLSRIEGSSCGTDSSNGPLQVFRSTRAVPPSDVRVSRCGGDSDSHAEQSASQKGAIHTSGSGRGELLPTPVDSRLAIPPSGHSRMWMVFAVASLAVATLAAVWLSPRVRTKTGSVAAPEQDLQVAATVPAVTESQPLPRTDPMVPAAVAPNQPGAQGPETRETARAAGTPTVAETDTKSKERSAVPSLRTTPKPTFVKAKKLGKAQKQKDCDPPYYIDPNGIRRVKHECSQADGG
jgi:serine/threonine-protein kinase